MSVEYSKRVIADLRQIAAYHTRSGNPAVAARIAAGTEEVVERIAVASLSGRPVIHQPGVRVAPLIKYSCKNLQDGPGHDPDRIRGRTYSAGEEAHSLL